jgi:hypothetical protein
VTVLAPPQRPDVLVLEGGVDLLERTLQEHHAATVAVGDHGFRWACLCGAHPDVDADPTDFATAWRSARHHAAEELVAALRAAS